MSIETLPPYPSGRRKRFLVLLAIWIIAMIVAILSYYDLDVEKWGELAPVGDSLFVLFLTSPFSLPFSFGGILFGSEISVSSYGSLRGLMMFLYWPCVIALQWLYIKRANIWYLVSALLFIMLAAPKWVLFGHAIFGI